MLFALMGKSATMCGGFSNITCPINEEKNIFSS